MTRLVVSPTGRELLDDPGADPALVARSLADIAVSNRWFGGLAAVRHGLGRVLAGHQGPCSLLDVGTGAGDVPAMATVWGRRHGFALEAFGLDLSPTAARLARARGLPSLLGCGGALPFRDNSVDVLVLSQVAHHLDAASCIAVFRECDRVARIGVVVADLRRSRAAELGFWLGSRALRFDPATRGDGITSLQRGFTASGLRALLAQAGIAARVERRPGARLVATWTKQRAVSREP